MLVLIVIMTMLAITVCVFSSLLTPCKSRKEHFSFRTDTELTQHSDWPASMGMARTLSTRPCVLGLGLPFLLAHVGTHVVQHLIGRAVQDALFVVTG